MQCNNFLSFPFLSSDELMLTHASVPLTKWKTKIHQKGTKIQNIFKNKLLFTAIHMFVVRLRLYLTIIITLIFFVYPQVTNFP